MALGYREVVPKPLNILADTSVLICLGLLATVQSDKETLMGPLEELDSRTFI